MKSQEMMKDLFPVKSSIRHKIWDCIRREFKDVNGFPFQYHCILYNKLNRKDVEGKIKN